jgi:hypothetical protein
MPGNPCPADRKDPGRLELGMDEIPWTVDMGNVLPKVVDLIAVADVSIPACKLCVEGFWGLAGVGVVCAMLDATTLPTKGKAMARARTMSRLMISRL